MIRFLSVHLVLLVVFLALPAHALDRDVVIEMLKDPALVGDSSSAQQLAQAVRSYRIHKISGAPAIQDGPFIGFILQNQILSGWQALYDSQYKIQHKKYVEDITYEGLLDILMQAVIADQLPAQLKDTGNQIGSCLARKVESASGEANCALDNSDSIPSSPSKITLGLMKYTCPVPILTWFTSGCSARKAIFAAAKLQLVDAKKQNVMATVFPQIFPPTFRSGLVNGVNDKRANIENVISHKFNAKVDSKLWESAPLLDIQDSQNRVTGIGEIAAGLEADIRAASVLQNIAPEIAAPLFYAAANRLIMMMGGVEATWNGQSFLPAPGDQFDPKNPTAAPKFVTDNFGGFGVTLSGKNEVMAPWAIETYDPTAAKNPSLMQLFPQRFVLPSANAQLSAVAGEKSTESMEDLGELMNAMVDFLELTGSGSALSVHFAPSTDFDRITNDNDPAIFPQEGRALAVGLIAAAVKNMIAPQGHVILPDPNAPPSPVQDDHSGIFGLRYYDQIDLQGRVEGKVPTIAIAGVFGAAEKLDELIAKGDPAIPQQLVDFKSTIDKAIELSSYSMIGRAQQSDGGFVETLGGQPDLRSFETQVAVLKTLTDVYNRTRTPAIRLSIREAWKFFDRFWANDGEMPVAAVGPAAATLSTTQSTSLLWRAMTLWNQTQSTAIFTDLMNPSLDNEWGKDGWDKWRSRFDSLHEALTQLRS